MGQQLLHPPGGRGPTTPSRAWGADLRQGTAGLVEHAEGGPSLRSKAGSGGRADGGRLRACPGGKGLCALPYL